MATVNELNLTRELVNPAPESLSASPSTATAGLSLSPQAEAGIPLEADAGGGGFDLEGAALQVAGLPFKAVEGVLNLITAGGMDRIRAGTKRRAAKQAKAIRSEQLQENSVRFQRDLAAIGNVAAAINSAPFDKQDEIAAVQRPELMQQLGDHAGPILDMFLSRPVIGGATGQDRARLMIETVPNGKFADRLAALNGDHRLLPREEGDAGGLVVDLQLVLKALP